ncbi:MAG: hypothetical protein VCE75_05715 [Alphaproteobacteria bacterium]
MQIFSKIANDWPIAGDWDITAMLIHLPILSPHLCAASGIALSEPAAPAQTIDDDSLSAGVVGLYLFINFPPGRGKS